MKMNSKITLSAICILALQSSLLYAETVLEPIVVSASKTEKSINDLSASVEIITAKDIEKIGAIRLRDALKFSSGMYSIEPDKISIRGMDGKHTLILIDGKRLTGEVGGGLELDRIDIANVERIEIIKGSASTLYGTDALGGVINVITKKSDKLSTSLTAQYGAFGSEGKQKSVSILSNIPINDKITASINASVRDFERLDNTKNDSIQKEGKVSTVGINLNYKASEQDNIDFSADYMLDEGDNYINNSIVNFKDDNSRQNYALSWKHTADNYNTSLRLYTSLYDKTFEVHHAKKKKMIKFVKAERETNVAEAQVNFMLGDAHLVSIGGEFREESFEGNVLNTGRPTNSGIYKGLPFQNGIIEIDYYAMFVQDQWDISDKLSLIGSVRYDDSNEFENDISPRVGLNYTLIDEDDAQLRFKTNYSYGFKTPTPADLYIENIDHNKKILVTGNPDLNSEKSKTFDVSLEGKYKKLSAKVSYFHTEVEDLIEPIFTGKVDPHTKYKLFSFENLSEATMDGVEFDIAYEISDNMGISANYTFLDAKGDIPIGPPPKKLFKSMSLENRPEHLANLKIHYNYAPWDMQVNVWGEYVGNMLVNYKRDKMRNIVGKTEKSYTLLHTSVTKGIGDDLEVYAGINNITDEVSDDIPLLGMFSYIGARYKF